MCDAPTDDADAPRVSPGDSQLVHVDCERCRSRLEVRVPRAFQLAGRDATVRCGACETLLQVAVPPSPRSTPAPTSGSQDSRAMHAAAAAFLRHHPVEDDHSGPTTAPSDAEHCAGMPPRSHDEQRRHMQLAQWHMNMAQRHSPPLGSLDVDSFFPYAPPPSAMPAHGGGRPTRDHVDLLLRQAAHDFWSAPSEAADAANAANAARPKKLQRRERKPREPSSYNVFIREEIPRLKREDPSLNHREAFKAAARNWAHSPLNLRSAAYAPSADAAGPGPAPSATDGANRNVRLEIMAKLHPHLLRSRREDLVVRDDDEDKRTANAKTRSPDAAAAEEAETSTRRNEKERADAVEAAARVVDALVEAATRRSTRHGGCVSSDKSTDGHAAWDGEWRRVDVPE